MIERTEERGQSPLLTYPHLQYKIPTAWTARLEFARWQLVNPRPPPWFDMIGGRSHPADAAMQSAQLINWSEMAPCTERLRLRLRLLTWENQRRHSKRWDPIQLLGAVRACAAPPLLPALRSAEPDAAGGRRGALERGAFWKIPPLPWRIVAVYPRSDGQEWIRPGRCFIYRPPPIVLSFTVRPLGSPFPANKLPEEGPFHEMPRLPLPPPPTGDRRPPWGPYAAGLPAVASQAAMWGRGLGSVSILRERGRLLLMMANGLLINLRSVQLLELGQMCLGYGSLLLQIQNGGLHFCNQEFPLRNVLHFLDSVILVSPGSEENLTADHLRISPGKLSQPLKSF